MTKYIPTIGMEVHCELKTTNKVFSKSKNLYGEIPNTCINEIDLGYPGVLPVLNKEVIELSLKAAIALNCKINKVMHFDRKNYFYPDLPKGYQITQNKTPIGYDGYIEIDLDGVNKKIGIERVHIEEDTSKIIYHNNDMLLDFNRAGVPLIEIVTKPDIDNAKEAVLYLTKLREILEFVDVSDVKIEEGSMRCEANVSIRKNISDPLGIKVEVKNIGSISAVEKAIDYEIERQSNLLDNNEELEGETRKFDERTSTTLLMRKKETGNDYRYFPEPDLPYVILESDYIDKIKEELPLLPDELYKKFLSLGVSDVNAKIISKNKDLALYFNSLIDNNINPIILSNLLTSDISAYLNKYNLKITDLKITNKNYQDIILKINEGMSSKIVKEILNDLLKNGGEVEDIINKKGLSQIDDKEELSKIINEIIDNNNTSLDEYNTRSDRVIKFLMGLVMKETKGKANPKTCNEILIAEIEKRLK